MSVDIFWLCIYDGHEETVHFLTAWRTIICIMCLISTFIIVKFAPCPLVLSSFSLYVFKVLFSYVMLQFRVPFIHQSTNCTGITGVDKTHRSLQCVCSCINTSDLPLAFTWQCIWECYDMELHGNSLNSRRLWPFHFSGQEVSFSSFKRKVRGGVAFPTNPLGFRHLGFTCF